MRFDEVKLLSKYVMTAEEVPLIWGHFGVGKTDLAKEIAEDTGRKLIILVISQMEPGDLIGLPARDGEKTVFLRPDWWPEDGNVILMIDEVNRAHRSIRNAIMQLLIERRIHNHVLPEGSWVLAAANPPDEEYDQVELITDPAFMSRFFHLEITPNIKEWTNWSKTVGVPDEVTDFVNEYPEFLSRDTVVSMRLDIRPSPRSWYKLGRVMKEMTGQEIEEYGYVLSAGMVGPEAARSFMSRIKGETELPSSEEILFELSAGMKQRIKDYDISSVSSIVLRLTKHLSELSETDLKNYFDNLPKITNNLLDLGKLIPKDSFFGIIRHLAHQVQQEKGLKRVFYDKLIEELAMDRNVLKFLERQESEVERE